MLYVSFNAIWISGVLNLVAEVVFVVFVIQYWMLWDQIDKIHFDQDIS